MPVISLSSLVSPLEIGGTTCPEEVIDSVVVKSKKSDGLTLREALVVRQNVSRVTLCNLTIKLTERVPDDIGIKWRRHGNYVSAGLEFDALTTLNRNRTVFKYTGRSE